MVKQVEYAGRCKVCSCEVKAVMTATLKTGGEVIPIQVSAPSVILLPTCPHCRRTFTVQLYV